MREEFLGEIAHRGSRFLSVLSGPCRGPRPHAQQRLDPSIPLGLNFRPGAPTTKVAILETPTIVSMDLSTDTFNRGRQTT